MAKVNLKGKIRTCARWKKVRSSALGKSVRRCASYK